jgi:hypothetical protein
VFTESLDRLQANMLGLQRHRHALAKRSERRPPGTLAATLFERREPYLHAMCTELCFLAHFPKMQAVVPQRTSRQVADVTTVRSRPCGPKAAAFILP